MMNDLTPTPCPRTGRPTWPHFVQYRLTEGPQEDLVLDLPPDPRIFPAPLAYDPATGRTSRRTGGAAYVTVIHDHEAEQALRRSGRLYGPHAGAPVMEDERETS